MGDFRAQYFASRSMHSVNISSLDTVFFLLFFFVCVTPLVEAWIKPPYEFLIRYAVRFDVG